MTADIPPGERRHSSESQSLDDTAVHGIVVDEPVDIENIELGEHRSPAFDGFGWETVPTLEHTLETLLDDSGLLPAADAGDGPGPAELERLEQEQLRLAAELARLRTEAAARERRLESELAEARRLIAAREAEISDQVAQIASLTLECTGLRSRLGGEEDLSPATGALGPHTSTTNEDLVTRLKERLEERGRAIAAARSEIDALVLECSRLRQRLESNASAPAADPLDEGRRFGRQVLDLLRRIRRHAREQQPDPALAGEPGSEVPTLAVDIPVTGPQERESPPAAPRRPAAMAAAPSPRRYLIALDEDRDDVVELKRPRTYVGRGAEADLRLGDATVSRLHALLLLDRGAALVEDASSTNGVFVNQRRVRRALLSDGDTVTFGTVRFQYRIGPPAGR